MTDRDRYILNLSEDELWLFASQGGRLSKSMLSKMLKMVLAERRELSPKEVKRKKRNESIQKLILDLRAA